MDIGRDGWGVEGMFDVELRRQVWTPMVGFATGARRATLTSYFNLGHPFVGVACRTVIARQATRIPTTTCPPP
jgi:hypothetical protein